MSLKCTQVLVGMERAWPRAWEWTTGLLGSFVASSHPAHRWARATGGGSSIPRPQPELPPAHLSPRGSTSPVSLPSCWKNRRAVIQTSASSLSLVQSGGPAWICSAPAVDISFTRTGEPQQPSVHSFIIEHQVCAHNRHPKQKPYIPRTGDPLEPLGVKSQLASRNDIISY